MGRDIFWNRLISFLPNEIVKGRPNKTRMDVMLVNGSTIGVTAASTIDGSFLREDATGNPYWSNSIDGGTY